MFANSISYFKKYFSNQLNLSFLTLALPSVNLVAVVRTYASEWRDSNPRNSPEPKSGAIPNFATFRFWWRNVSTYGGSNIIATKFIYYLPILLKSADNFALTFLYAEAINFSPVAGFLRSCAGTSSKE